MVWPTARPVRSGRTSGAGAHSRAEPHVGRVGRWLLVGALLVAAACEPADPARVGAERFIDRYYVEIDVPAAKEHAVGFATTKLERELELLAGIEGPESGGKPDVNYRFLTERAGADERHRGFLYELTIRFGGGGEVVRRALVTVRDTGAGDWRVANFEELD